MNLLTMHDMVVREKITKRTLKPPYQRKPYFSSLYIESLKNFNDSNFQDMQGLMYKSSKSTRYMNEMMNYMEKEMEQHKMENLIQTN